MTGNKQTYSTKTTMLYINTCLRNCNISTFSMIYNVHHLVSRLLYYGDEVVYDISLKQTYYGI